MRLQLPHRPGDRSELLLSVLLGTAFAVALFVLMALAQMLGDVKPPKTELDETLMAFNPPEILELQDEPPPPEEEEEPPPDLEEEPPQLSLDQLDIALNPGTGDSLAGDFAMPTIGTSQRDLGTEDFVDFSELDQIPRPLSSFNFPRRLLRKQVKGQIVLMVKLDEQGKVLEAELESSTLPEFDRFVLGAIKKIPFTPPTKRGEPVKARARLPIPINIK